jgi:hypothetical protein
MVLNRGRGTAAHLHHRARAWCENLPATHAALSRGELDVARAAALADVLGQRPRNLARAIEAVLLPQAAERRAADVFLQPGHGMATLGAELAADEAAEAYAQIDQLARMAKADGDPRRIAEIRTELFSLLLRRPGGADQPGVSARLTVPTAPAPCSARPPTLPATAPPTGRRCSSRRGTAPAGCPMAGSGPAGSTSTTSSRTAAAAGRRARTSAACAAPITA